MFVLINRQSIPLQHSMDLIKEEPDSNGEEHTVPSVNENNIFDVKQEEPFDSFTFVAVKSEVEVRHLCDA